MLYKILKAEVKNSDWKVLSVQEAIENGEFLEKVSINRLDKKTNLEAWTNWAGMVEGHVFEGNVWTSEKGTTYLFPPKQAKSSPRGGFARNTGIKEAQETKRNDIESAQVRKHEAIAMAGAQRDAVLMVTTFEALSPFPTDEELKSKIESWMKYFLNLQSQPFL